MSNQERNAEIISRRKAGQLPRQIAAEMGLSKNVVIGVTNRAGLSVTGFQYENAVKLRGEDSPSAILTLEQVRTIRRMHVPRSRGSKGFGAKPIARALGLNPSTVRAILERRNWAHVP